MAETGIDIIKNKITNSPWSDLQKREILAVLPKMGSRTTLFLERRLSRSDFRLVQNELYTTFSDGQKAMDALLAGQDGEFVDFLNHSKDESTYNFGEYLLPLVLDAKDLINRGKINSEDNLSQCLEDFELLYFRQLPPDELERLLKNNLLYFVNNLNIVMEFKWIYLLVQFSGDDTWAQRMLHALEDNQEMLGNSGLTRDGKNYPQTVANWFKDYVAYINKPVDERAAFDQVQYIERAPNVQRLNVGERKDLLEIIKLHAWLMSPEVTEAEIDAYESELANKANGISARPAPAVQAPSLPVAPKPTGDWIKTAADTRAQEQEKIDSKLNELKNKVKDKI